MVLAEDFRKGILKGAEAEDRPWEIARIAHWHFYRSNDRIEPFTPLLQMERDSKGIFLRRVAEMRRLLEDPEAEERRVGEALGRVIHHLQDMGTPSHAVPIYHLLDDRFEGCMVAMLRAGSIRADSDCPVEHVAVDPEGIYRDMAEGTLEMIRTQRVRFRRTDGKLEEFPWSVFWRGWEEKEDPKNHGFGTFGTAQALFGRVWFGRRFRESFRHEGVSYRIEEEERRRICELVCSCAVRGTLHFLGILELERFFHSRERKAIGVSRLVSSRDDPL
jgi:hypothetical protein